MLHKVIMFITNSIMRVAFKSIRLASNKFQKFLSRYTSYVYPIYVYSSSGIDRNCTDILFVEQLSTVTSLYILAFKNQALQMLYTMHIFSQVEQLLGQWKVDTLNRLKWS